MEINEHTYVSIKLYFQNRQQPDLAHGSQFAGPDLGETKIIKYKDECTIQNHQILKKKTKSSKEN